MKSAIGVVLLALVGLVLFIVYTSLFVVVQTQQAVVFRFGQARTVVAEPGLHFKASILENVVYFDRRLLDLDTPEQEVIASDQRRVVLDAFARYRITDPLRFFQEYRQIGLANVNLSTILNTAVRNVVAEATFTQIVRDDRAALMDRILEVVNRQVGNSGVRFVDVRIRRADLPAANAQAVYSRMQTERQREAAEIRAQGNEAAQRIRARADRDVTVTIAEAESKGQEVRGEGDSERNRVFAEAYNKDKEFFSFWRSMQAYEASFRPAGEGRSESRMVLSPDSDFFRFFADPSGRARMTGPLPAPPQAATPAPAN